MKRKAITLVLIILLFAPLYAKKKGRVELPERYKKWLEEEVIYIITPREKHVFLQLGTDKEREIFIEAFWKQRDPTTGTPRNEFREEHYRRLSYANGFLGRGTPKPGWKTDQGRVYIILGQPISIETYDNVMNVYPTQIWFYLGDPKYGLPPAFNIVFFKKVGIGEYILYSPSDDGPQSLIADYLGDAKNLQDAYQRLSQLEPNLARHTLSLIPGERSIPGFVSLASNALFSAVFSSPQKKVEDKYATEILKYKDIVEVEYTANYIGSDSLVRVMRDDSGFFLVHYSVEPQKLSVDLYENRYNAHFELNGRITDRQGNTIFQYAKEIPLSFSQEQINDMQSKSFALQDMFPLVPGNYQFSLLVKNTISKEFTSLEKDITVPADVSALQMTSLILGYQVEKSTVPSREIVPFRVGENQILCQSKRVFTQKETMYIFFQLFGLSQEMKSQGMLRYVFSKGGEEFFTKTKKISEYNSDINFIEEYSLENLSPGYYRIEIFVLDKDGDELLSETEDFELSPVIDMPRPLIISKVMPASRLEEYMYTSGIQLLKKGNIKDASVLLEKAYHKNPSELKYGLGFAQVLFINGEYQRVKEILTPFLENQGERGEILYFLGKSSHALGQFEDALSYYKSYLSHLGTNLEILNLMGSCYYQLGNKEEALQVWQRSLEINPDQEQIKKLVKSLKVKKEQN